MRIHYPAELPITARKDEIVQAIRANQVVVVAGDTGSGKTTQLPKMCLEAGRAADGKLIGCTQPRRIAAVSVAERVQEELAAAELVGYKIRIFLPAQQRKIIVATNVAETSITVPGIETVIDTGRCGRIEPGFFCPHGCDY